MASHRKPRPRPAFLPLRASRAARTAANVAGVTVAGAVSLAALTPVGHADPAPAPAVTQADSRPAAEPGRPADTAPSRADQLSREAGLDTTAEPAHPLALSEDPQDLLQATGRLDRAGTLDQHLLDRYGQPTSRNA